MKTRLEKLWDAKSYLKGLEFTKGLKGAGQQTLVNGAISILDEFIEEEKSNILSIQ